MINIIYIQVKTNKKNFDIKQIDINRYIIYSTQQPIDNKCNKEIIEQLSKYFKISKININIVKGHKSKNKILEILL